eukprot:1160562-Pelagomonas_calceolata.AAC.1
MEPSAGRLGGAHPQEADVGLKLLARLGHVLPSAATKKWGSLCECMFSAVPTNGHLHMQPLAGDQVRMMYEDYKPNTGLCTCCLASNAAHFVLHTHAADAALHAHAPVLLCPVGVVGAAVMPVVGIGVGLVQIARGVANTGEAIRQRASDKIWDDRQREWVNKPDGTIITAEAAQASTRAFFKPGAAKGVNYYEVLQVRHVSVKYARPPISAYRHGGIYAGG